MLFQTLYTSTSSSGVSLSRKIIVAEHSVKVCRSLGITGRVLAMPDMAINIIEGPKDIVEEYNRAVNEDDMIGFFAVFYESQIETRSFADYSVWLSYQDSDDMDGVHRLDKENINDAINGNLAPEPRIMTESYMSMYFDFM